jgi:acyl dehydratase
MEEPMDLEELNGIDLGSRTVSYVAEDAILYALAIGAHATDLDLVYERDLEVIPTFAVNLGLWTIDAAAGLDAFDPLNVLHAAQGFELHTPLPASATFEVRGRVSGVWDKGSAAILDVSAECDAFNAVYSMYLPGRGGWGGDRGPSAKPERPEGEPIVVREPTSPDQAALYRLTGDTHPLHIDPDVAKRGGFDRPILHGLCTFGFAARQLAAGLERHPSEIRKLSARFVAPAFPGDVLGTEIWPAGADAAVFETSAGDTTVLAAGTASFAAARPGRR